MPDEIINDALANFTQKRTEIFDTKTNVQTRREVSRDDPEAKRSPVNRLIRGSLTHALRLLRDDPRVTGENRQVLYDFAHKELEMKENLDRLDSLYLRNVLEIEDGQGGSIHAVTLDLKELEEGEEDDRVPWIIIGGATSSDEQNAALPMAMALQGMKVTILTYPEQMKLQEGGDGRSIFESLKNKSQEDLEIFKHVAEKIGYKKANLMGHSLGGAMVLAMAADPELAAKIGIQDVVALSPTGFEKRNFAGISLDFLREGGKLNKDPEAKVFLDQGVVDANRKSGVGGEGKKGLVKFIKDSISGGRAAGTKMMDEQKLAQAASNVSGNIEIWTASTDKIINAEAIAETVQAAPLRDPNKVSVNSLDGGDHNSYFTNAFGFTRLRQEDHANIVSIDLAERSGAEYLLKQSASEKAAA